VWAVVVTHRRLELLRACLDALGAQRRAPEHVLVVDNASGDGTVEAVRAEHPEVEVLGLPTNEGGAGGFHEGLGRAVAGGAEWVWLMDDDTIPQPDALQALLDAPGRLPADEPTPVLLASRAVWDEGALHPMNAPGFERDSPERVVRSARVGLMPIRTATFVSLLVHRDAVARHGLPHKHFFIWSDDIEYTARVLRHDRGYVVPTSVVHHRTKTPYTAVSSTGGRFYYHVRNSLYMIRGDAWSGREKLTVAWLLLTTSIAYLRHHRFAVTAIATVGRGLRDGVRPLSQVSAPREG